MGLYRKKPVVIEARQLAGTPAETHAVYLWVEANTVWSPRKKQRQRVSGNFGTLEVTEQVITAPSGRYWPDPAPPGSGQTRTRPSRPNGARHTRRAGDSERMHAPDDVKEEG